MSPAVPIPLAEPLPLAGPAVLFWLLLNLTFLLHTVAMNLLVGGALLTLLWRFRGAAEGAEHRRALAALFTKAAPALMAATVTLGVPTLLFVQVLYGRLFFTSSIVMGVLWLSVVPLLIVAYAVLHGQAGRRSAMLGLAVAPLLVAVAFLYTANISLMLRPEVFVARYQADGLGLRPALDDPALLPRYLHTLLSALAVGAAGVIALGLARRAREAAFGAWAVHQGLIWFACTTAANVVVGLWYLVAQPRTTLAYLFSHEPTALALVGLTFLLPLILIAPVPVALRSEDPTRGARHLLLTLAVTLVVMVLLRDQVRQAAVARAGLGPPAWVEPQWAAIGLFLVLLPAGAAIVVWMTRALARGRRKG
jgi:hypothetical protein